MKKLVVVLLAVIMAVSVFAGCEADTQPQASETAESGTNAQGSESADAGAADGKTFKVAYVNKTLNNPFYVALDAAIKEEVENRGWQYISLDASDDITKEQENLETVVSQKVDAIIMNAVDPEACVPSINAAVGAGIPVICVDTQVSDQAKPVTTVLSNNYENGYQVGQYVGSEEIFPADEEIISVLLSGAKGNLVGQERRTGLMAGIIAARTGMSAEEAKAAAEKMEQELTDSGKAVNEEAKFRINSQGWGNWTADEGLPAMEDMLVANKDINLVLSENDNMLLGAKTALDNAGMTEQIWLAAGADGQKEAYEEIMKEGSRYLGTGENNPYKIGTKAVEIAEALLSGETDASSYDAITPTEALAVTKENVAEIYNPDSLF